MMQNHIYHLSAKTMPGYYKRNGNKSIIFLLSCLMHIFLQLPLQTAMCIIRCVPMTRRNRSQFSTLDSSPTQTVCPPARHLPMITNGCTVLFFLSGKTNLDIAVLNAPYIIQFFEMLMHLRFTKTQKTRLMMSYLLMA